MPVTLEQEKLLVESKELLIQLGQGTSIDTLSERSVRLILAYKMWGDGMVWKDVQYILQSKDPFWNQDHMLDYCKNVFGL